MFRSRSGFTLLEIMLAITIGVLIMALAVPSVSGLMEEQRARRSFDAFEGLVRQARQRAMQTRLPSRLLLEKGQIVLQSDAVSADKSVEPAVSFPIGEEEQYSFQFPAALDPAPTAVWTFWPTGGCEPAVISYLGPEAKWTATYNALTTQPDYATEAL